MIDLDYVIEFATKAHGDQKRKYTGEPYIEHPMEVARMVRDAGGTKAMIAAAMLHDVVEDTDVTIDNITDHFGDEVAELVGWLTDVSKPEDGNRAHRKAMDRAHMADAPAEAKTIKLADMIDNSISITTHDPKFAKVYMVEKAMLLEVLQEGDVDLFAWASQIVDDWFENKRG